MKTFLIITLSISRINEEFREVQLTDLRVIATLGVGKCDKLFLITSTINLSNFQVVLVVSN